MEKTYRDIYKWGDYKHEEKLQHHVLEFLEESYKTKALTTPYLENNVEINLSKKGKISPQVAKQFISVVGKDNYSDTDADRAKHSGAKFYLEILKARKGIIDFPADAVIYPKSEKDVMRILSICKAKKIPVVTCGGRTSVTRALELPKGGISLDMTRHMNKVVRLNEKNSTVTVEAGIMGPELEKFLNSRGYTCGHFPQSFEFSTPGGWVSARGAGQASTGYGKMEDMLISMKLATTEGILQTKDYPATSIGPDIDQIILGSEGTYGVITEITMKIRKYDPKNSVMTSFMFKDFESSVSAMREVMQGGFGLPHFFRVQDPEETELAFRMSGKTGSIADKFLTMIGYTPMNRSLMHVIVDGDRDYSRFVLNKIKKVAKKYSGFETGKGPVKKWLEQRYSSAYLRDAFMDQAMMLDTLETAVSWENLHTLWENTRKVVKSRPETFCLVHISHAYENGANLYFIFMSPMKKGDEIQDFTKYQREIIDSIHKNGGSLSHHHGIGRMLSPWMKGEVGELGLKTLAALKKNFDPSGIMNPGGMLGL